MIVRLYALFDRVAQLCGPIGEAANDAVAMRSFKEAVRSNPNRSDFQLLFLGEFDQAKGVLIPETLPVVVEDDITADLAGAGNGR